MLGVRACAIGLTLFATTVSAIPIQWTSASGGNGHYYEVVLQDNFSWDAADNAAQARPGNWHLATITSSAENQFIESLLTFGDPTYFDNCVSGTLAGTICRGLWIGGASSSNVSNDWSWVTGEAFSYADWGPFEPFNNGDRIRLDQMGSTLAWNDVPNARTQGKGYIVEINALPTGTAPETPTVALMVLGLAVLGYRRRKINE